MEQLSQRLNGLPERHRAALQWFLDHAGTEQPWPQPLPDGTLLATKAKGIYKPNWTEYALSIRQSLGGPYPDREPITWPDGAWSYLYFQEKEDPQERDTAYTNRGLLACWQDKVPVGILRQVQGKPEVRYAVLGLALVAGWEGGYFFLEGFSPAGWSHGRGPRAEVEAFLSEQQQAGAVQPFDPATVVDGRKKVLAAIVQRQGQGEFRAKVLMAYRGLCAVTGCDVAEALEAAHIVPYRGPDTNHPSNGLLLRADLHTLFDLGLMAIDSADMRLLLSPRLTGTAYADLAGKQLQLPDEQSQAPSKEALDMHRCWSGL
jgi:hypothetical protein